MGKKSRTIINLVCSLGVLVTNIIVGFFLSPYIVAHIGVEANGFVTLANNFVTYANLIVTALNSMAARFITLEYTQKNYKKANVYYNSVFWGNLIIVAALLLPAAYLIARLQNFINVPDDIVLDVKILFSFVFFNFFITTGMPNWDCGVYVKNRLDRQYIPSMVTSVLRCVILLLMFTILVPHVWYVSLVSSIIMLINLAVNGYNTAKLTPELKIRFENGKPIWSKTVICELVGSGIWNSISSVGSMLLSGLDLIICNIFIDATAMGVIALSKTLPSYMQQFSMSITRVFAPELIINYAKGNREVLLHDINRAIKITSVLLVVPLAGIIVMSRDFFALWVPSQDAELLSRLTIVTCFGYAFTSGTQILYNVFSTVNKVKTNAIMMVLSGAASTLLVFILLNTTDFGIYAVAGCSTFVCLIRNLTFTIPYTAKYLGLKKTTFFPQVFMCFVNTVLLSLIGFGIRKLFTIESWIDFLLAAFVIGGVCIMVSMMVFLSKNERSMIINRITKKIFGKRKN